LANQLVGVFSIFLDIDKVLNNKAYKGYLQIAGHSVFRPNHGPILPVEIKSEEGVKAVFRQLAKEKSVFIVTNHKRFGVNEAGKPHVLHITFEKERVRPKLEPTGLEEKGKITTVGGYDVVAYVFEGMDVMFWASPGRQVCVGGLQRRGPHVDVCGSHGAELRRA